MRYINLHFTYLLTYLLAVALFTCQTNNHKRFIACEVAADWHELMIPQRTMQPSIARVSEQLNPADSKKVSCPEHTVS